MLNTILEKLIVLGGIPLVMLIIGYLAGRHLKPWIHENADRLARAQEIALVADRVTDEMTIMFPGQKWDNWIDEAVDRIIEACGLTDADDAMGIAHREVAHQIVKKHFA